MRATFDRRATPLPDGVPFGLTEDFAQDRQKQTQWQAFIRKYVLGPVPLAGVMNLLRGFLISPLHAARADAAPGGHDRVWSRLSRRRNLGEQDAPWHHRTHLSMAQNGGSGICMSTRPHPFTGTVPG
ncbi:MAG: hypothetical protein WAT36_02665 [Chromatiaceae bacterium]